MSGISSTGRLLVRAPNAIGRVMKNVGVGDKKTDVLSMTKRRGGALIIAPKVCVGGGGTASQEQSKNDVEKKWKYGKTKANHKS
jgi:hypothetical protein